MACASISATALHAQDLPMAVDDAVSQTVIPVSGQTGGGITVDTVDGGTSSWITRRRAIRELSLQSLPVAQRQDCEAIVDATSLFRRLPTIQMEIEPRVYEFFKERPDVAVSIWRAMGISKVQMWQTGPTEYESDAQDGTVGTVTVLRRTPASSLAICYGEFLPPNFRAPIRGAALMHLQTRSTIGADGRNRVTHFADIFVSFPSQTVETIARIISPVTNRIADKNFEEVSLFLRMMDVAMARQPGWVENIAHRLEGVLPERDDELLELTAAVYVDAQRRLLRDAGEEVSLEAIRPPVQAADRQSIGME